MYFVVYQSIHLSTGARACIASLSLSAHVSPVPSLTASLATLPDRFPEDNKVSEWAKFYIDYARLKKYLERAKKASEARDALKKRRPALAAEVIEAYRESREAHLPPPTASTPPFAPP